MSVDVIVPDGRAIRSTISKQEDFEITRRRQAPDDRDVQARSTSTEKAGDGAEPLRQIPRRSTSAEAARDHMRLFAIFLDDYHVRRSNSLRSA